MTKLPPQAPIPTTPTLPPHRADNGPQEPRNSRYPTTYQPPEEERIRLGHVNSVPMSTEELGHAVMRVQQIARERDVFARDLELEKQNHTRTKDRLTLVQNELEKAQADRDLYMRMAIKYATLIDTIHDMSVKAKTVAEAARNITGETNEQR